MKVFRKNHVFEYHWSSVTQALWQKYPNPFSTHVIASDILDRRVDSDGRLHTVRLIHKTSIIPSWGRHLMHIPEAFIVEVSVVDPIAKTMDVSTKNITMNSLMTVEEVQHYTPSPDNPSWTLAKTEAIFSSNMSWGIRSTIESFGHSKFRDHFSKSRNAFLYVLERIKDRIPSSVSPAAS